MTDESELTAVILAGGRGRRMSGQDKGLLPFEGRPLVSHVIDAIAARVSPVVINANRNIEAYQRFGCPVIVDRLDGYQGPLAGFLAALGSIETPDALFLPCDTPRLNPGLVDRLQAARAAEKADIAVAHDGTRLQSVCAIVPVRLKESLQHFLDRGERKIDRWYALHKVVVVDFSDQAEMFVNINTLDDLKALEQCEEAT